MRSPHCPPSRFGELPTGSAILNSGLAARMKHPRLHGHRAGSHQRPFRRAYCLSDLLLQPESSNAQTHPHLAAATPSLQLAALSLVAAPPAFHEICLSRIPVPLPEQVIFPSPSGQPTEQLRAPAGRAGHLGREGRGGAIRRTGRAEGAGPALASESTHRNHFGGSALRLIAICQRPDPSRSASGCIQ